MLLLGTLLLGWLVLADTLPSPAVTPPSSAALRLGLVGALTLGSFGALLGATRPVGAIFAFLAYLGSLLLAFFGLEADYVGAIHLLVYPGAILIFFVFATLTTDQRGSWCSSGGGWGPTLALALPLGGLWWWALANGMAGAC